MRVIESWSYQWILLLKARAFIRRGGNLRKGTMVDLDLITQRVEMFYSRRRQLCSRRNDYNSINACKLLFSKFFLYSRFRRLGSYFF